MSLISCYRSSEKAKISKKILHWYSYGYIITKVIIIKKLKTVVKHEKIILKSSQNVIKTS